MTAKFVWRNDPMSIVGRLQGVVKKRQLEVARKIFDGVVMRTPVYTGSARASWRVSTGSPGMTRTQSSNHLNPLGPPSFTLVEIPLYARIYISNATPYIMRLEYGWSKQAPAGMLRVTLASLGIRT